MYYVIKLIFKCIHVYIHVSILYIYTSLNSRDEFIRALFMSLNRTEPSLSEFGLFNIRAIIIVRAQLVY